jgi:hypothetical protein
VCQGLREVAEVPARRGIELLCVETKAAGKAEQALAQLACPGGLADLHERRDEPERAGSECRLGILEPVIG